jgi:glycosyltransferase involved in cell wall biosynthesis
MSTILFSYKDHTLPRGGGAVHGHHVVEQLRRLGHRLITAEPKTDERLESRPRTARGLVGMLAECDAIYLRSDGRPFDLSMLALNRARYRRPVVIEINAMAEEQLAYGQGALRRAHVALLREQYRRMARASSVVVCVSRLLAGHVLETYGLGHERVLVVPNGGTPSPEPPAPRDDGRFRVVWAGGARWPWQALDSVLGAAEIVLGEVPGAEVVLYTDARGMRVPERHGLRVLAPVPHAELAERLGEADVALCLYRPIPHSPAGFYNSPLKLFDYMARGLPVVASRLGQISEVIEDGVSGVLVGDDPREIARELIALARDPARRRALGQAALERIRSRYSWNHTGDALGRALELAKSVER